MTTRGNNNNWGDQRIADLGKSVVKIPVLSLVSRCYQLVNANIDDGMAQYWNVQTFQNMFSEIVVNEDIPIPFIAYDDVEKVFFYVYVTKVDINRIEFLDDENRDVYPTYNVTATIHQKRKYIGDELHFYQHHDYREFHERIKQGWDMLRILAPDGQMTVPFDRKITPFDICEVMNFVNLSYRLLQFAIWEFGTFSSEYPIEIYGAQVINRYSLLFADTLMSMSMQPFAYACRLPNNPKAHFIYGRPCIIWHDAELPKEQIEFMQSFPGISDLEDARIITMRNMPYIYWSPITTCDRHDISL